MIRSLFFQVTSYPHGAYVTCRYDPFKILYLCIKYFVYLVKQLFFLDGLHEESRRMKA